jgi:hypothetical protein
MASTLQRDYIKAQVEAFIERLGETGTWNKAEALAQLSDWVDTATFQIPRKVRVTEPVSEENQCMARKWNGGDGGQCTKCKIKDSDFCKACAKKNAICSEPASYNEDGSHTGLFWGRIDNSLPIMAADGKGVAIMWKMEDVKDSIRETLSDGGQWHPFCTHPPCRTRDWDAKPITTMTSVKKKSAKSKSKKSKSKKEKKKRTKNGFLFFMGDTRAQIKVNLEEFISKTGMVPLVAVHFLTESENDCDTAISNCNKLAKKKTFFKKMLERLEIEGEGKVAEDFVLKGRTAMGPIAKLGGAIWSNMSDENKAPFQKMAADAKEAAHAEASDVEVSTEMSDDELKIDTSEIVSVEDDAENSDIEVEDIVDAEGKEWMVGEGGIIYDDDGDEIGKFDRTTKTASLFDEE